VVFVGYGLLLDQLGLSEWQKFKAPV
jgi:hypothetical protein